MGNPLDDAIDRVRAQNLADSEGQEAARLEAQRAAEVAKAKAEARRRALEPILKDFAHRARTLGIPTGELQNDVDKHSTPKTPRFPWLQSLFGEPWGFAAGHVDPKYVPTGVRGWAITSQTYCCIDEDGTSWCSSTWPPPVREPDWSHLEDRWTDLRAVWYRGGPPDVFSTYEPPRFLAGPDFYSEPAGRDDIPLIEALAAFLENGGTVGCRPGKAQGHYGAKRHIPR